MGLIPDGSVAPPLLEVRDFSLAFETAGRPVRVVDRVCLTVPRGRIVSLVGESGCGKSATALSILRLISSPPGRVLGGSMRFHDNRNGNSTDRRGRRLPSESVTDPAVRDLLSLDEKEMRRVRGGRIAMVFQEPMTALNPVYTVGEQIAEAVELHRSLRGRAGWEAAVEAMGEVGIADPGRRAYDYPHQLSGGMCQRVMIAMALACRPALLIADEPTTALDVTVQRQVLELLRRLQVEYDLGVLLITHDLGVVAQFTDHVYVMYAGRIVEHGPTTTVLSNPRHPYTLGLLGSAPRKATTPAARLSPILGTVPDPSDMPTGCRFHPRCARSAERARDALRVSVAVKSELCDRTLRRCVEEYPGEPSGVPVLREINPGHHVACWEADSA